MNLRQNWSRTKEVLGAYWRQGLHELGSVFYGSGTAAQHPQYGMLGTRTPGEVADGLRAKMTADPDRSTPSPLENHLDQTPEPEPPAPEPERDDLELDRE